MKEYTHELTGTIIKFPKDAIFKIYCRRSNCPKRLLKATHDPQAAIDAYLSIKLFRNDKAYLYSNDTKLLHRNGKEERPYSLRGYKKPENYKRRSFNTPNFPETVYNKLLKFEPLKLDGITRMSVSRILILLASEFVSLPQDQQIELLRSCVNSYKYELLASGCDNNDDLL